MSQLTTMRLSTSRCGGRRVLTARLPDGSATPENRDPFANVACAAIETGVATGAFKVEGPYFGLEWDRSGLLFGYHQHFYPEESVFPSSDVLATMLADARLLRSRDGSLRNFEGLVRDLALTAEVSRFAVVIDVGETEFECLESALRHLVEPIESVGDVDPETASQPAAPMVQRTMALYVTSDDDALYVIAQARTGDAWGERWYPFGNVGLVAMGPLDPRVEPLTLSTEIRCGVDVHPQSRFTVLMGDPDSVFLSELTILQMEATLAGIVDTTTCSFHTVARTLARLTRPERFEVRLQDLQGGDEVVDFRTIDEAVALVGGHARYRARTEYKR